LTFAEANLKPALSHPVVNLLLPCLIASLAAACAWTILVLATERRQRRFAGVAGGWAAAVVLAALWQAEAVPWLWVFVQGVLLVWLGAVALMIAGAVSIWRVKEPGRVPLLACGVLSIVANMAAGWQFLWQATVSAGGV